jgi:CubicO group peptidase (beta-lactamase class C family)
MRRLVLDPLGMMHSTYQQPLPLDLSDVVATGHTSEGEGEVIIGRWRTYPEMAAAGLWTTPTDLLTWAISIAAVRNGGSTFVARELVDEMLTPQIERMGLGVILRDTGTAFHFAHSGSNVGYRSRFVYYPATGQGAVVLTNGNHGAELGTELFAALAEVFEWPVASDER